MKRPVHRVRAADFLRPQDRHPRRSGRGHRHLFTQDPKPAADCPHPAPASSAKHEWV